MRYHNHHDDSRSTEYRDERLGEDHHDDYRHDLPYVSLHSDEYESEEFQSDEFYGDEFQSSEHHSEEFQNDEFYSSDHYSDDHYSAGEYQNTPDAGTWSDTHYASREYRDDAHDPYINSDYYQPEPNDYQQNIAGDLRAEDFYDANHYKSNRVAASVGKFSIGVALSVLTLGVSTLVWFASKPPMTPAQIVQMEGYKGAGPQNRTAIFNLASLRGCVSMADCDLKQNVVSQTGTDARSDSKSTMETVSQVKIGEIPAAATPGANSGNPTHWIVRKQWSLVREAPNMSGAIVSSLTANSRVAVTRQIGEWAEVASISKDDSSALRVMGYMHQSLLQPL